MFILKIDIGSYTELLFKAFCIYFRFCNCYFHGKINENIIYTLQLVEYHFRVSFLCWLKSGFYQQKIFPAPLCNVRDVLYICIWTKGSVFTSLQASGGKTLPMPSYRADKKCSNATSLDDCLILSHLARRGCTGLWRKGRCQSKYATHPENDIFHGNIFLCVKW